MKNMTKIIIGISLLLICISVVSAANPNEIFTAPTALHPIGHNDFVDEQGHNIMLLEYTDDAKQRWFENDTNYSVTSDASNNTNIYIGLTDEDNYYLEIVEKEGTKYIVGSWTPNDSAEDIKIIADNLIEFNKLNQLTPAEV